jgi:hypothetical protein
MAHFFTHKFTGLSGRRFSGTRVLAGALDSSLFGHNLALPLGLQHACHRPESVQILPNGSTIAWLTDETALTENAPRNIMLKISPLLRRVFGISIVQCKGNLDGVTYDETCERACHFSGKGLS